MEYKNEIEPEIQELIQKGYRFNLGDYLSQGWQTLNKDMGQFVLFTVVWGSIYMAASFLSTSFLEGPQLVEMDGTDFVGINWAALWSIEQIATDIISLVISIILTPLIQGNLIVAAKINRNEPYKFQDFFSGYSHVAQLSLGKLATYLIATLVPSTVFRLMLWYNMEQNPISPLWMFFVTMLLYIPMVYFSVGYMFTFPFILFRKYNFWTAMEASRLLIGKNWFYFFVMSIALGLIVGLSAFLCLIPLIFTLPFYYCALYAAFADMMNQAGISAEQEPDTPGPEGDLWGFDEAPANPEGEKPVDREDPFLK